MNDSELKRQEVARLAAPRKRVFTVVGPHLVGGKRKGEVVEMELTDGEADALITAGHVVEKSPTKAVAVPTNDEATATENVPKRVIQPKSSP